jgi:hypothetical protein
MADDDEASQHGETAAPTTDGEGEDDGDGEINAGPEEVFYADDHTLVFAASVPLPDEDDGDDHDGDSDYQDDGDDDEEDEGEVKEEGTEEQEGAAAEPNEGEPATDDEDEGTNTPEGLSSFRHPGEPFVRG